MQAKTRMAPVVSSTLAARRRVIRTLAHEIKSNLDTMKAASVPTCLMVLLFVAKLSFAVDRGYEGIAFEGPNGSYLQGANLRNNSQSRQLDKDGYFKVKPKSIGRVVNPTEVLITAPNWTAEVAVRLYTSVSKLPDHVFAIHVLYYCSKDVKSAKFLGYAILSEDRKVVKLMKYDGPDKFEDDDASAWIAWLKRSLESLNPEVEKDKKK